MLYADPLLAAKSVFNQGSVRFFLGENGYVKEFRTPGLLDLFK
jgi:hypothetical protein